MTSISNFERKRLGHGMTEYGHGALPCPWHWESMHCPWPETAKPSAIRPMLW